MCDACGCSDSDAPHDHPHDKPGTRVVTVERKVLAYNDELAAENRRWLADRGIVAVNLISSPGSGKTMLLERTLEHLNGRIPCAVITGDQQTDNDARRLAGKGAPVEQIQTHSACHLNAAMVGASMRRTVTATTQLLFIENVGNLVCPAAFDLGENLKVALLSITEGEDKPLKYPALFTAAAVAVLTKLDLAPHLDCDVALCRRNVLAIRHDARVLALSARTGDGMAAWLECLAQLVR